MHFSFFLSLRFSYINPSTNETVREIKINKKRVRVTIFAFSIFIKCNLAVSIPISSMLTIVLSGIIVFLIYRIYRKIFVESKLDPAGKYVLITGCDSGFGNSLALELDRQGFNVFAGVLLKESISELTVNLSTRSTVFLLDITKTEDIETAFTLVKSKTNVLHALVNNAGIATGGFIDWTSMDTIRRMMEVNYFGHVAITKKLIPLLIKKRDSRVINVCSMCGFLNIPGSAAYCASKFALESFSDCLRREMVAWGLRVSIIEPGTIRTTMTDSMKKVLRNVWTQTPVEIQQRWGETFFNHQYAFIMNSIFMRWAENPNKVIRVLVHAVTSTKPRIHYRPGWQSSLIFYPLSLLPVWVVDKMFATVLSASPAGIRRQLIA